MHARKSALMIGVSQSAPTPAIPLGIACRVLENMLAWHRCAWRLAQVAARLDYDGEFDALRLYEETKAAVSARCRFMQTEAPTQAEGLWTLEIIEEIERAAVAVMRGDKLERLVPAETVGKILDCLAAWEKCAGRMRDFIADADFYDEYGMSAFHADLRHRGFRSLPTRVCLDT